MLFLNAVVPSRYTDQPGARNLNLVSKEERNLSIRTPESSAAAAAFYGILQL